MDIVKRLRNLGGKGNEDYNPPWVVEMTRKAHRDAADEIERLRKENAKLKEEVDDLNNRLIEAAEMADYHD